MGYQPSHNDTIPIIIIITITIFAVLMFLFGVAISKNIYYKRGQIDALNGVIKYELVEEKTWKFQK